mgnify:CR=1 FL=1
MLLSWHQQDPVSAREIERNNAIYARQGNRNPFIDNPNYVNLIWGGTSGNGNTGGGNAVTKSDLYFSEYVEGSSNNKAIEIKNETIESTIENINELEKTCQIESDYELALRLSREWHNETVNNDNQHHFNSGKIHVYQKTDII